MKTLISTAQSRVPGTWDPFAAFSEMRRHMDEFMSGVLGQQRNGTWRPGIDVDEDELAFTIHIEVPGWEKDDITIEIDEDVLTISGQCGTTSTRANDERTQRHGSGSFIQSLSLPSTIDSERITARLERGLLTVVLPKKPQAALKRIAITSGPATPTTNTDGGREPSGG